jgi:type II secretory pathway pseudopilin PulG
MHARPKYAVDKSRCVARGPRGKPRGGFTFVESMVAVSITSIAGAALLLGVSSALQCTRTALEQTVGLGMAQQMMDELAGKGYCEVANSPYDITMGPTSADLAGPGRSKFTNIEDYNGLVATPPLDPTAITLGIDDGQGGQRHPNLQSATYFNNWQRSVVVYYVDPTNLSVQLQAGQTSNYRAVEVRVSIQDRSGALRPVITLRRVFAYIPNS